MFSQPSVYVDKLRSEEKACIDFKIKKKDITTLHTMLQKIILTETVQQPQHRRNLLQQLQRPEPNPPPQLQPQQQAAPAAPTS